VLINFFHLVLNVQNSRSRFPRTASHDAFDPPHLADRGSLRSRSTIQDLQNPRAQKHWERFTRQCTKTLGKSTNNSPHLPSEGAGKKKDCAFLSFGTAISQAGKQATKPPARATAATCMACMEGHRTYSRKECMKEGVFLRGVDAISTLQYIGGDMEAWRYGMGMVVDNIGA
jgi:hypothetical protein